MNEAGKVFFLRIRKNWKIRGMTRKLIICQQWFRWQVLFLLLKLTRQLYTLFTLFEYELNV